MRMGTEPSMKDLATIHGEPLLERFEYEHHPESIARITRLYAALAYDIVIQLQVPKSGERDFALQKLLDSKNVAVSAIMRERP
jgi:hypothetical protein